MKLNEAEKLAVSLLTKHKLVEKGWRFEFDNAVKRFGVCRFRPKIIGLSSKLTELNDIKKVKDTILHEIAHAIAGYKVGHGIEWKRVCIQIGAKPERCYDNSVKTPDLKYKAVCGGCGKVHQKSRIVNKTSKRSCRCQSDKGWEDKILLNFVKNY